MTDAPSPLQPAKPFYEVGEVYPFLTKFRDHHHVLVEELKKVNDNLWRPWPEKELYGTVSSWLVFPFYGFEHWIDANCERCPETTKLLKSIPGLRTALYSCLGPKSSIRPHKGWGVLANHVLRCHYGLLAPDNCGIWVEGESRQQKNGAWLIFDDSRFHSGFNFSEVYKLVLLIDIERPAWMEKGNSDVEVTLELSDLVQSFGAIL
jgi:beta-hydroxylase